MARKSRYLTEQNDTKESVQNIWRCGIYRRLSEEDGDTEESNSIGNQKKICLHYLSDKGDIAVEKIYTDNGYTGMNYDRPGFREMWNDMKAGVINCVVVKDISRLGRHFVATSEFVEKIFPSMGIRLVCVNDIYDSESESADTAQLLMPIKMVMNESYILDISKKIRSSINSKIENGEYLPSSSSIPYGYLRNPEQNTFDIDPEPAAVVRRIYELRASGWKFNAIAKRLTNEGIESPGHLRFTRGVCTKSCFQKSVWCRSTIRRICTDQVYLGCRIHGKIKKDRVDRPKTFRDKSEWMIIPGMHEPIISRELFDRVQEINKAELAKEAKKTKRAPVLNDKREIFRGKIVCGDCMTVMQAGKGLRDGTAFVFYVCREYMRSHHTQCSRHFVREEDIAAKLEKFLAEQIDLLIDQEKYLDEAGHQSEVDYYRQSLVKKQESLQKQRSNIEERMEMLLKDWAKGIVDTETYEYAKARYSEQIDKLLILENKNVVEINKMKNAFGKAEKWLGFVKRYRKVPELTKELIDELVESIEVYNGSQIKIRLKYGDPFKELRDYITDNIKEEQHAG